MWCTFGYNEVVPYIVFYFDFSGTAPVGCKNENKLIFVSKFTTVVWLYYMTVYTFVDIFRFSFIGGVWCGREGFVYQQNILTKYVGMNVQDDRSLMSQSFKVFEWFEIRQCWIIFRNSLSFGVLRKAFGKDTLSCDFSFYEIM